MTRPGNGKRSRKSCDAASGDDEPHRPKLTGDADRRQAAIELHEVPSDSTPRRSTFEPQTQAASREGNRDHPR
jgi:hypothetical protein